MINKLEIRKCLKCGTIIEVIKNGTCNPMCCGEEMKLLVPNSVDAAIEKHIPIYEHVEDEIFVKVNHVMEKEHFIEWIAMITDTEVCKVTLYPEQNAECRFKYIPGATLYAYCNKHGLWKTEVK